MSSATFNSLVRALGPLFVRLSDRYGLNYHYPRVVLARHLRTYAWKPMDLTFTDGVCTNFENLLEPGLSIFETDSAELLGFLRSNSLPEATDERNRLTRTIHRLLIVISEQSRRAYELSHASLGRGDVQIESMPCDRYMVEFHQELARSRGQNS